MQLFKQVKKLTHRQLVEVAKLSFFAAIFIAAAVGIQYGGVEQLHRMLAVANNSILPSSQTADVLPCSWFNNCGVTNDPHFSLTANTYNASYPGQPITLTWAAYNNLLGTGLTSTNCTSDSTSQFYCYITGYGGVGDPSLDLLNGSRTGSVVVYPTQTTTYTLVGSHYYAYVGGGGYGTYTWPAYPSVTISVPVCTAASFGSPWNSASYLIYSGGQGTVYPPGGGRYCIHNYSGSAIFIPDATQTEWNNFYNSAAGLSVGVSSY